MFNVGDTVQDNIGYEIWTVTEIENDGLVAVIDLSDNCYAGFDAENLRHVEVFTYQDLAAADQDARDRGCAVNRFLSEIWQDETVLCNIYLGYTAYSCPLPRHHAWVHREQIIREATDND